MAEEPDPLLSRLSEFLAERIGLHFPPQRHASLASGMRSAARELGYADVASCIRALLASGLERRETEILASHLTVGETYFFRESEALLALEAHVLPELDRSQANGQRSLRLWSAGCATGEEAYSLAIALARSVPQLRDWKVSVIATDFNPLFLRKAAAGIYGTWSFRGVPAALRHAFFDRTADGRWQVAERIRAMVSFSYLNLADDHYPSLENGTNAMDVIFCRNVLMYFTPARAMAVLEKLGRCLVPGGRLFVSPVEIPRLAVPHLELFKLAGAFGYRKTGAASAAPSAAPAVPPAWIPLPPGERAAIPQEPADAAAMAQLARACANEGRLVDALAWCGKALAADRLDARWHYLRATILQEHGDTKECGATLARALYLDPHCALAHFALGNLSRSLGKGEESRRHFRNALCVLAAYQDDEVLPESEGLSAGRLAEIIQVSLSSGAVA